MSFAVRRISLLTPFALLAALVVGSCVDDVGPQGPVSGHFAFNPTFQSSAAGIVELNRVRVVLTRADQSIALDTIIPFNDDQDSLDLTLRVEIIPPSETFTLTMEFLTPAGAVAFAGGPITVTATTSSVPVPEPVNVPLQYVGVGSNAVEVRILTENATVPFGGTVEITTVALDSDGAAIEGTPTGFTSLNTDRATIPDEAEGQIVGGTERGPVQIVATLLTGPADTALVTVEPVPTEIAIVSGDGQTGVVMQSLPSPLVVAVTAADGLGVENVEVVFATPDGGTLLPAMTLTNADGEAQADWELGPTAGSQTATASADGLDGSPVTFTATAGSTGDPFLAFTVQPSDAFLDQVITPSVEVTAFDATGAVDQDFSGNLTLSLASNPGSATLGGTTSVAAQDGVATFSDLTIDAAAGGYTLEATAEGYDPDTSDPFTVFGPGAISWTNAAGGDWFDPANWDAGRVPQAGDTAVILLDGSYAINIASGTAEVAALTLAGANGTKTLSITGGLTVASTGAPDVANPAFDVGTNGEIVLAGPLTLDNVVMNIDGSLNWQSGDIDGTDGSIIVGAEGNLTVDQVGGFSWGVNVTIQGSANWIGGDVALANDAVIQTDPAGLITYEGTGVVSGSGSVVNLGTLDFTIDSDIELAVTIFNGGTSNIDGILTLTGVAAGDPAAIVQGNGTLDLSSADFGDGLFGNFNPGTSPGTLTIIGDIAFLPELNLNIELDGLNPGTEHDQLTIAGDVALDGNLNVTASFTPSVGDQLTVMTFNASSGTFANVTGLDLGGGLILEPVLDATTLVLQVQQQMLAFTAQPTNTAAGNVITPAIEVTALDGTGTEDTDFTGDITIAIASNPSGGVLSGTTTVTAQAGVATFSDISIDAGGIGYTLEATTPTGYAPATSNAFDVIGTQMIVWTNANGGDWFDPANWSTGTVPQPADTAVITLDGTYTVDISTGTAEVGAVTLGGSSGTQTLSVAGNSLIANEPITVGANAVVLVTGTLTVEDAMTVDGILQWQDGFIDGGGTVTISSGGQLDIDQAPIKTLSNVQLRNEGTSNWLGGDISLLGTAQIVNASPGTFSANADATVSTDEAGDIVNESLFEGSGDPTTIAVPFTNSATGTLDVGGIVEMTSSFTHEAGAVLQGTSGTLDLSAASSVVLEGDVNPGTSPGILNVTGALPLQPTTNFNVELDGVLPGSEHDQLNVTSDVTLDGTLNVITSFTPAVDDEFTILTYNDVSGAFADITGQDLGGGLILELVFDEAALLLQVQQQTLAFTVEPSNTSVGNVIAPAIEVSALDGSGAVDTDFTGEITIAIATNPGEGSLSGTATVPAQAGVATFTDLSIEAAGIGYTLEATTTSNYAPATSGTFDIIGTQMITWTNASGGDWFDPANWDTGTIPQPGDAAVITLDGTYTVDISSGTAEVDAVTLGGTSGTQTLTVDGNSLNATGSITVGANAVVLLTGTLTVQDVMTVDGILQWQDGTIDGGGTVTIGSGGQLEIDQTPLKTLSDVQLRNEGSATWSDGDISLLGSAQIVNASPGTFNASADATMSTDATADILNESLFENDPIETVTTIAVPFTNDGTLDAGGNMAMTNTFTHNAGAVIQGDGTLDLTAAAIALFEGDVDPGDSPGILGIVGSVAFGGTTGFNVELDGLTVGSEYDRLDVTDAVTLGGTMNVLTSFTPAVDDQFTILTYNTVSGAFADITGLDLGGGLILEPVFDEALELVVQQQTLAFTVPPSNTPVGNVIAPAIEVSALDGSGAVDTDFTGDITIAIATNPPGEGSLLGTTTVTAQAGVATFTDLSIDAAGIGYTLEATTVSNYAPATSGTFDIVGTGTITWTNASGGDWFDPANWDTGTIPQPGDAAVIALDGTYTVDISSGTAEVDALTLGGSSGTQTLTVDGNSLSATGSITVGANAVVLLTGTLTVQAVMTVDGILQWQDGTIDGGGTVTIGTGGQLEIDQAPLKTLSNVQLRNEGSASWLAGDLSLLGTAQILNASPGTFSANADATVSTDEAGDILNESLFENAVEVVTTIGVPFVNADAGILHTDGTVVMTNTFTHNAGAVLQGTGSLDLSGASIAAFDGDVDPGDSPGILGIVGPVTFGGALTFNVELDGLTAGTEYDQLNVTGAVTLGGTMNVITSFTPTAGDQFTVMDYSSRTETFSTVTGLDLGAGLVLDTVFSDGSLVLEVRQAGFAFTTQPSNALPFQSITPDIVVEALDPFGNVDDAFVGDVTLSIDNNAGDGTIIDPTTATATAAAGVATFTGVGIDSEGTGYTLRATDTDFADAVSDPFDILAGITYFGVEDAAPTGIFTVHPDATNNLEIASTSGSGNFTVRAPRWSPNHSRVAYSFDDTGSFNNLFVVSAAGDTSATVVSDRDTFWPRWSPDGSRLAYECSTQGIADVCVIPDVTGAISDLDGNGALSIVVTDIVDPGLDGSGAFAWNPTNSNEIAVVRDDGEILASTIYIVDVSSGTVVDSTGLLTIPDGPDLQVQQLDWSPDGSLFAFSAVPDGTTEQNLYTVNTDGTGLTQQTTPGGNIADVRPVFSPDGTEVLFQRNEFARESGLWSYHTLEISTGTETQVTDQPDFFANENELTYDYSPDGSEIVLVGTDLLNLQIYVVPSTTTSATYLTDRRLVSEAGGTDIQPAWRP